MIVDKHQNVEVNQNGFGRSERMSIDENSLQHIMSVLTNLYSDPAMAVIREYSTNAYDSHVAAGKEDVAIEVKLPDYFEPVFKLRDFGIGMSEEEVYGIYGRYGASTKRDSNDYVGQLGLGCKSALTYTDQFTLVAIKDGIKNVFNIHLDESGIPSISKAQSIYTDSGNGVEIIVPVSDVGEFRSKAENFYRFFPGEMRFVNEESFSPKKPQVFMEISPSIFVVDNVDQNTVVMGGVPYRADRLFKGKLTYSRLKFLIYADVGDVNFTPSREELHYTGKTTEFLNGVEETVIDSITKKIQEKVDSASSYLDAHIAYKGMDSNDFMNFAKTITRNAISVSYKGIPVPLRFHYPVKGYAYKNSGQFNSYDIRSTQELYFPMYNDKKHYNVVYGKGATFSSIYKKKVKAWLSDNPNANGHFIYVQKGANLNHIHADMNTILSGLTSIDVEKDLADYKFAGGTSSSNKPNIKDMLFDRVSIRYGRTEFSQEKVDTSKPILTMSRKEAYKFDRSYRGTSDIIQNFYNIYVVNKPQRKDFKKAYTYYTLENMFTPIMDDLNSSLSDEDLASMFKANAIDYQVMRRLNMVNSAKIKDEEFLKLIEIYGDKAPINGNITRTEKKIVALQRFFHGSNHPFWYRLKKSKENARLEVTDLTNKIIAKYPLLFPDMNRSELQNAYTEYVNNIHKED